MSEGIEGELSTTPQEQWHAPTTMLRRDSVIPDGTLRVTGIFCPHCGMTMAADEGFLERGDYLCSGANTYAYAINYAPSEGLPDLGHDLVDLLLSGLPLEMTGLTGETPEQRVQASEAVTAAIEVLYQHLARLKEWHELVMAGDGPGPPEAS